MHQTTRPIGLGGMLAVALLAHGHARGVQPHTPPRATPNSLVPNPGMEQVDAKQMPAGWSGACAGDTQIRYRGKRSLRLTQKGKGGVHAVSATFAVEPWLCAQSSMTVNPCGAAMSMIGCMSAGWPFR